MNHLCTPHFNTNVTFIEFRGEGREPPLHPQVLCKFQEMQFTSLFVLIVIQSPTYFADLPHLPTGHVR